MAFPELEGNAMQFANGSTVRTIPISRPGLRQLCPIALALGILSLLSIQASGRQAQNTSFGNVIKQGTSAKPKQSSPKTQPSIMKTKHDTVKNSISNVR